MRIYVEATFMIHISFGLLASWPPGLLGSLDAETLTLGLKKVRMHTASTVLTCC